MFFEINNKVNKTLDRFFDKPTTTILDKDENKNKDEDEDENKDEDIDENIDIDENKDEDEPKIAGKTPYIIDDKEYYFLDDNVLNQTFGDFMDVNKKYNVHICIYNINSDCDIPFVEFLLDKTGETIAFPHLEFQCPPPASTASSSASSSSASSSSSIWASIGLQAGLDSITDSRSDSVEPSQDHTFFMNECSKELLKVIPIHDIFNEETLSQMYKGFIECDDRLYIVFDSTKIMLDLDNTKYIWTILDEILYSRIVLTKTIDPEIIKMFTKTPEIMYILDKNGKRIMHPALLYICSKPDEIYKTVEYTLPDMPFEILEEPVEHSWFGNHYIFSSIPLDGSDILNAKRYAVFTYNARYILKDVEKISQEERDAFTSSLVDTDNLTIYYREGGVQLWCIKSSDQFTLIE